MTQTKPLSLSGLRPRTALIIVILSAIWMTNPLPAHAQGVVGPSCISPLLCRGLVPESLTIYATMPDANGVQLVTTSFRVVNVGPSPALPSSTLVQSAGNLTYLPTPALAAGDAAYFSTTTSTTQTDFMVTVTTANQNIAAFHFLSSTTALGRWRPIGPSKIVDGQGAPLGVGRITTIALDPSTSDIVYAGATNSGLWKTTDGGAHWIPLTDALPTVNIYAVALDEADPQHVFIATQAGIFGSTDGGHVWARLNPTDFQAQGSDGGAFIVRHTQTAVIFPGTLLAHLNPGIRLYLTTKSGLWISRDGGVNWLPQVLGAPVFTPGANPINSIIESLDQDRSNPDHMLATVVSYPPQSSQYPGVGVYETYNGGLTPGSWHLLQGCPGAPAPNFSPGAFSQYGEIWVTQSGGTQWISDKAPVFDPNTGKKIGVDHELWRTTSQTCTVNGFPEHGWQLLSSGFNTPCIGDLDKPSNWSYLHADPTNPLIVYKAGIHLCRSTDAGASFTALGVLHADHHALVFHPTAPGTLFEGNDGGLYRSDDGGKSWAFDSEWLQVTEFLDVDQGGAAPRKVVGGAQDNAMSASDLSSPVWHDVDLSGDPDGDRSLVQVDPLDPTVQYTMGQAANHLSKVKSGVRDTSSVWGWDTNTTAAIDPFNSLPEQCNAYDTSPRLFTQFLATGNSDWHLLTTVGTASAACDGGIWAGPPWRSIFVPSTYDPSDTQVLVRLAYDPSIGLFLAGGDRGGVYIGFSPNVMAKVFTGSFCINTGCISGRVSDIVPDPSRTANYFVSLEFVLGDSLGGRVFEIGPSGQPLQFNGQDITANLPFGRVTTITANPFEPGILYAGTVGAGVWRGVRDANGNWKWHAFNNGLPQGGVVTKLRVAADGTIYAGTYGRGTFALDTVPNLLF